MNNFVTSRKQSHHRHAGFTIVPLNWLEDLNEAGYQREHCSQEYQIIWVSSGTFGYRADLQEMVRDDRRLFMMRPGQMHLFSFFEDTRGFRIIFTEDFLATEDQPSDNRYYNSLFRLFMIPEGISIHSELAIDFEEIMQKLAKEYSNTHFFRTELLRRYFKILLVYLAGLFEDRMHETSFSRNAELVNKFMHSLESKFKTQKMVSAYAAELLVTPNYLNEIIKKTTGFSAGHHIRNRVAMEAKRLCRYSDSCMKEIAYHLGFTDSAHFSKFFKSITGKNFTDYKKELVLFSAA